MSELTAHYADYYSDETSAWRERAAVDKAANVVALWREACPGTSPERVVEIGCGEGAVLHALDSGRFGARYTGLEISQSALGLARQRQFGSPVEWVQIVPGRLPLPDESADLAVLSHVVEHVADPRGLIADALRVARYVVVEVPLEHHWRHPRHFRWTDLGHINVYTPDTLRWLVESALAPSPVRVLAERITSPIHQHGRLRPLVKGAALRVAKLLALRVWTYHGALIATRH